MNDNEAVAALLAPLDHAEAREGLTKALSERWTLGWGIVGVVVPPLALALAFLQRLLSELIAWPDNINSWLVGFPLVVTAGGSAVVVAGLLFRSAGRRWDRELDLDTANAQRLLNLDWDNPDNAKKSGSELMEALPALRKSRRRVQHWSGWSTGIELAGAVLLLIGSSLAYWGWQHPPAEPIALQQALITGIQVAVNLYSGIVVNL